MPYKYSLLSKMEGCKRNNFRVPTDEILSMFPLLLIGLVNVSSLLLGASFLVRFNCMALRMRSHTPQIPHYQKLAWQLRFSFSTNLSCLV